MIWESVQGIGSEDLVLCYILIQNGSNSILLELRLWHGVTTNACIDSSYPCILLICELLAKIWMALLLALYFYQAISLCMLAKVAVGPSSPKVALSTTATAASSTL